MHSLVVDAESFVAGLVRAAETLAPPQTSTVVVPRAPPRVTNPTAEVARGKLRTAILRPAPRLKLMGASMDGSSRSYDLRALLRSADYGNAGRVGWEDVARLFEGAFGVKFDTVPAREGFVPEVAAR